MPPDIASEHTYITLSFKEESNIPLSIANVGISYRQTAERLI